MWRELWQWLTHRLTARAMPPKPEAPPTVAPEAPEPTHTAHQAEDEPWPFGHHVPPEVEHEAERHRGEWRS